MRSSTQDDSLSSWIEFVGNRWCASRSEYGILQQHAHTAAILLLQCVHIVAECHIHYVTHTSIAWTLSYTFPRATRCCSVLQCGAVRCSALQCVTLHSFVLQSFAVFDQWHQTHTSVTSHTRLRSPCPILGITKVDKDVAVYCSVLQCIAVFDKRHTPEEPWPYPWHYQGPQVFAPTRPSSQ